MALKGLVVVVAAVLAVQVTHEPQAPVQHAAAVQMAHHDPKPAKAKRLPHMRVVQVGARIRAHVTVKI